MPCTYYTPEEGAAIARDEAREKLNTATKLLCEAMSLIEQKNLLHRVSPELSKWWKNHKAMDEKRKKDEQIEAEYRQRLAEWEAQKPKK